MTKESQKIYDIDSKIESPRHNRSPGTSLKSKHHHKSSKHKKKDSRSRSKSHDKKDKSRHRTKSPKRSTSRHRSKKPSDKSKSRSKSENKIVDKSLLKSIKKDVEKLNQMKLNFNSDNIQYSGSNLSSSVKARSDVKSNEINEFISKCKEISSSEKQLNYVNNSWKVVDKSNLESNKKDITASKTDSFNQVLYLCYFRNFLKFFNI
jgi:hypothetical protein